MFSNKTRRSFRVSTSRVYLAGRKNFWTRFLHSLMPYARRGVYRRQTGAVFAL